MVAPADRQGGTTNAPTSGVHLVRGLDAPSGKVRLARGLNAPSATSASLEDTCTNVVHAPAPVQAFNALTPQDTRHDPDTPGNHVPALFHQLPREGHPRHCVALCDEAGVTPAFRRGTKCISYVRQDQFTHI
jgi:hypothetical protein